MKITYWRWHNGAHEVVKTDFPNDHAVFSVDDAVGQITSVHFYQALAEIDVYLKPFSTKDSAYPLQKANAEAPAPESTPGPGSQLISAMRKRKESHGPRENRR